MDGGIVVVCDGVVVCEEVRGVGVGVVVCEAVRGVGVGVALVVCDGVGVGVAQFPIARVIVPPQKTSRGLHVLLELLE